MDEARSGADESGPRLRAGLISLVLLAAKYQAYLLWSWLVIFGTVGTMGLAALLAPLLDRGLQAAD